MQSLIIYLLFLLALTDLLTDATCWVSLICSEPVMSSSLFICPLTLEPIIASQIVGNVIKN
mgnify:FL=1